MLQALKWQKDLQVYKNINTTFIIEGNVNDFQPWIYKDDGTCEPVVLSHYLHKYLTEEGYTSIVFYNRIDGFGNPYNANMLKNFITKNPNDICLETATQEIRSAMKNTVNPTAIIVNMANTISTSPDNLTDNEVEHFLKLMLASKTPTQAISFVNGKPLTNLLFLIVEKVNDIPAWFYLNNPYVRTLTILHPEKDIREVVVNARIESIDGANKLTSKELKDAKTELTLLTQGMTLVELFGIFTLCREKSFNISQIKDAVKMFRFGETESQWDKMDIGKVKNVQEFLERKVKGQNEAVKKVSDVLSRASLGLSSIQGGNMSKPKGVLFFAGPTGTGKTELAKTIAEFIFGDANFVIRFDMSEYKQSHSDQKLLGAPPGYVGYSSGGQLTNAVKAKPFCVLLFDEIDKAHPSVLDKFLQILDDGRITDSSGQTVYFSESLIVFTSNLGVIKNNEDNSTTAISPNMSYEQVKNNLLKSISNYFKHTIHRPELFNRIGDNFVVFDFIRETAAQEILDLKLNSVINNFKDEKGITLVISENFKKHLYEIVMSDLSNGGRGIGNIVESKLINPIANILIHENRGTGFTLELLSKPDDANSLPLYKIL